MTSERYEAIVKREESLLCRGYARYPIAISHGKGCRLWDVDGKEYIDLLAGIAVTSLGHANEELAATIAAQAGKLLHVSNLFYQEEQLDLAERLLGTAPHAGKVFFCNSGAEANEAAIKLARRYSQRVKNNDAYEIITLSMCFHGRTLATVAATGRLQDGFAPMPEGFLQVPYGDVAALRQAITSKTAAVMMEAVQGEGGVRPASPEYMRAVADLCKEKDILLIMDEVQCGMARTGKWWAFQHYGIEPDIFTTAKALANGLPMGTMVATDKAAAGFVTGSHATTFGGNAMTSAVAAKVLEIMQRDNIPAQVAALGQWAKERFARVADTCPGCIKEIRGMGLILGIDLSFPGKEIWAKLIAKGFILNLTQDTVLRLVPPLTVTRDDLEAFAVALEEVLASCDKPYSDSK